MAVLFQETFESLSNGTVVTNSNLIFDQVTGADCTVQDSIFYAGSKGVAIGSGNSTMERNFTARGLLWAAFAFNMSSAPPGTATLLNVYSAATVVGNLRLNTGRTLNFRDGATSRWTSSTVLATNTWYEIHVKFDAASDVAVVKIYNAAGTLLETSPNLTMSSVATATIDEFRIGNLSGAVAYNSYMDRMIFDGSDEPAVLASSTPWIYYDNGTSWIDVSGSLYYDNGTSWELVVVGTPVP